MGWMIQFMAVLPKNAISQFVGWLVRLELPAPLNTWLCRAFAIIYKINLDEAESPIDTYSTLEDFFTRRLKDDIRPVVGPYCSPADGTLVYSEAAESGNRAIQVKGVYYSLDELIYGRGVKGPEIWQWFTTVYLAPHNYHRVHAPISGRLQQVRYVPGELWPVNETFVGTVPQLFINNERLVFDFLLNKGGKVAVVMVGARNVGRMCTSFWPDFFTNDKLFGSFPKVQDLGAEAVDVKAGDEIGTFMLGSTAVVVLDEKAVAELHPRSFQDEMVLMGTGLSDIVEKNDASRK